jgi:hypothetical protein
VRNKVRTFAVIALAALALAAQAAITFADGSLPPYPK